MNRTRALVLCTALVGAVLISAHPSHAGRPTGGRTPHAQTTTAPSPSPGVDGLFRAYAFQEQAASIVQYVAFMEDAGRVVAYVAQVEADQAAAAAAARAAEQPRAAAAPAPAPMAGGDCSGFPLPADIIQRESGGDPNAVNPSSGTFGCAQLQPFHFAAGGACAGMSTDKAGQIACTYELQRRAGMSPWQL